MMPEEDVWELPADYVPRERVGSLRLYLILTVDAEGGGFADGALESLLVTGAVDAVQLRFRGRLDRDGDPDEVVDRAWYSCRRHDVLFLVNDDPQLALESGADGAHVGQSDLPAAQARSVLGNARILGLSTHGPDEVALARGLPVDYVGLGPCFPTSSKALDRTPGGPELVRACLTAAGDMPVFPIGGITLQNAPSLVKVGATRLAVGAGILDAPDPPEAARRLRALLPD